MKKWVKILIVSLLLIETICVVIFGNLAIKRDNKIESVVDYEALEEAHKNGIDFFRAPTIDYKLETIPEALFLIMIGTVLLNTLGIYLILKNRTNKLKIVILALCLVFCIITFFIPVIRCKEVHEYGNRDYRDSYKDIYNIQIIN